MRNQFRKLGVFVMTMALQPIMWAQEPAAAPKPSAEKPAAPATSKPSLWIPSRLQFVISKYQGEKKTSSLPYSLSLNTNGARVSLRMGATVPVATSQVTDGKSTPTFSYRDVGVSIDGSATLVEAGLYRVDVVVDDSSIYANNQVQGAPAISGVPVFRHFRTNNSVLLRDGQSTQLTTAADPVSGEVMRVDVTFTVVK